ncbi:MAG TPA: glucose-1-phosphate adenylyltransferase [Nitrospiria bacterium]|jgi:glucose-1-phosphate adenylyltransferase|nr:glucose-1-phosphate adenylyltransferase [Nitrospiria bacterium]
METVEKTLTIILAGGTGSRLHPLTADRAKPAVPFGGIYRIIDFALSNCLHSGLRQILVLTQYKSHSLQKHLRDGWSIFNPEIGNYITTVPAQMRTGEGWYAGTADAIKQNRYLLERSMAKYVLVLMGDHIYRMDYARMLEEHVLRKLDVTVACVPVPLSEARFFGVVEIDEDLLVRKFVEKSENPSLMPNDPGYALASMGIYVFNLPFLLEVLALDHRTTTPRHDFGMHILPDIVGTHTVGAYRFGVVEEGRVAPDGYWQDVGTLDAYYEANMDLLKPIPPINLYQHDWPIRTYHGQYPPARNVPSSSGQLGSVTNALLAGGDVIIGAQISHSILSPDVWVDSGAVVEDSILFERVRVGCDARLRRCIIDKDVQIPPKETIGWDLERDRRRFTMSEGGVVVVPKGYRF